LAKIDEDIKNYMTLLETLDKEDGVPSGYNSQTVAYILAFGVHLIYFLGIFLFLQNISKKIGYLKI